MSEGAGGVGRKDTKIILFFALKKFMIQLERKTQIQVKIASKTLCDQLHRKGVRSSYFITDGTTP